MSIHAIDRIWDKELEVSGFETTRWLNRLNIDMDDIVDQGRWAQRLVAVVRSPTGPESLSSHYWNLLAKLVVALELSLLLESGDTEVMRSLEEAEDWEKLGDWMVVVWSFLPGSPMPEPESVESIEEVTLKLLLRRPTALQGFEDLCKTGGLSAPWRREYKDKLQHICDQARAKQPLSDSLPPYVSVCSDQYPSILMPPFLL